jgi:hypothetical protein
MAVKLNHTIVAARDRKALALFMTELLGLTPPMLLSARSRSSMPEIN